MIYCKTSHWFQGTRACYFHQRQAAGLRKPAGDNLEAWQVCRTEEDLGNVGKRIRVPNSWDEFPKSRLMLMVLSAKMLLGVCSRRTGGES